MAGERVEVITRVERRRRWSLADKLRLVAATRRPGATVAAVAREHGVSEGLLYTWRGRLAREAAGLAGFVPVAVVDQARPTPVGGDEVPALPAGTIEIALPNGCRLRVQERVSASALRKVIAILGGLHPAC